jgi:hypothetical protein
MSGRNPADIEASRKRLKIPADYQWSECAAGCGDVVWHPPMDAFQAATMPFVMTCSATCAMTALNQQAGGEG